MSMLRTWLDEGDAYALADVIWLQRAGVLSVDAASTAQAAQLDVEPPSNPASLPTPSSPEDHAKQNKSTKTPERSTPIDGAPRLTAVDPSRPKNPIRVSGARALPNARALECALRPLRRRVAHASHVELIENDSVELSAKTGRRLPVFRPTRERWLDLALLIDESAGMAIWRDTLAELRLLCERAGLFRAIKVWRLDPKTGHIRSLRGDHAERLHALQRHDGRQLIWVATSGIGAAWANATWLSALHDLAKCQPVAILQMLPGRLWRQASLARHAEWVYIGADTPAAANGACRVVAMESSAGDDVAESGRETSTRARELVLPWLPLDGTVLHHYSRLVRAGSQPEVPGTRHLLTTALAPVVNTAPAPAPAVGEPDASTRWRRFCNEASRGAIELTLVMSGIPLQLPIIRLAQVALLPHTGTAELAELFYSGLIRREATATPDSEAVYNFVPGLRDEIAQNARTHTAFDVIDVLSNYISERIGRPYDFMADVVSGDEIDIPTFAEVRGHLLERIRPRPIAVPVQGSDQTQTAISLLVFWVAGNRAHDYREFSTVTEALAESRKIPLAEESVTLIITSRLFEDRRLLLRRGMKCATEILQAGFFVDEMTCEQLLAVPEMPFSDYRYFPEFGMLYRCHVRANAEEAENIARQPFFGARILWVNDHGVRQFAKRLESLGAEVEKVSSTRDAKERLKRHSFDAVISDFGRQGEAHAGLSLLDYLDEFGPFIPAAVHSRAGNDYPQECLNFGAVVSSSKFTVVESALANALAESRLEVQRQRPVWCQESLDRASKVIDSPLVKPLDDSRLSPERTLAMVRALLGQNVYLSMDNGRAASDRVVRSDGEIRLYSGLGDGRSLCLRIEKRDVLMLTSRQIKDLRSAADRIAPFYQREIEISLRPCPLLNGYRHVVLSIRSSPEWPVTKLVELIDSDTRRSAEPNFPVSHVMKVPGELKIVCDDGSTKLVANIDPSAAGDSEEKTQHLVDFRVSAIQVALDRRANRIIVRFDRRAVENLDSAIREQIRRLLVLGLIRAFPGSLEGDVFSDAVLRLDPATAEHSFAFVKTLRLMQFEVPEPPVAIGLPRPPSDLEISPLAFEIARRLSTASADGVSAQIDTIEIGRNLQLPSNAIEDALQELGLSIRVPNFLKHESISASASFLAAFDRHFQPWNPSQDAVDVARVIVGAGYSQLQAIDDRGGHFPGDIARKLGFEPRRANPAIQCLIDDGNCDAQDGPENPGWLSVRVRSNSGTLDLVRKSQVATDSSNEIGAQPTSEYAKDLARLVERIAQGDADAEPEFINRFQGGLRAVVRRHLRPNDPQLDDVVQDVLADVLQKLRAGAIRDPIALSHYLILAARSASAAHNRALAGGRDTGGGRDTQLIDDLPAEVELDPMDSLEHESRMLRVRQLVESLKQPRDRELIQRFYLQEESRETICREMNINASEFRRVLSRAHARLRDMNEGEIGG